ncbi:MAG: hypothetical protein AAF539_14240, partial [Planctomycetota bacterium]
GPASAVGTIAGSFRDYVKSISFDGDVPDLKDLPDGWRMGKDRPMRFATVDINTPGKQLDLSISKLSIMGSWDSFATQNVNRWRGQVGLEPSPAPLGGAESLTTENLDDERPLLWVDIQGMPSGGAASMSPNEFAGGVSGAPFASGGQFASSGPFASGGSLTADGSSGGSSVPRDSSAEKVDPHAGLPMNAQEAVARAKATQPEKFRMNSGGSGGDDSDLKFAVPDGWRPGRKSMMRKAAFNAGPEDASAEVTVIQAGGDLRGNVARWMGQVSSDGVPDADVDAMLAGSESVVVSGRDAQRFRILPDEDDQTAIDATIVPLDNGMSLFVKMTGPKATVAAEDDSLSSFLDSLRFR